MERQRKPMRLTASRITLSSSAIQVLREVSEMGVVSSNMGSKRWSHIVSGVRVGRIGGAMVGGVMVGDVMDGGASGCAIGCGDDEGRMSGCDEGWELIEWNICSVSSGCDKLWAS